MVKAERTTVIPRALEDVIDPEEARALGLIRLLREVVGPDAIIDVAEPLGRQLVVTVNSQEEEPRWPAST